MTFAIVNVISKQFLPYFFKNLLPLHYSIMNAWVEKWKNVMAFAITAAGGGGGGGCSRVPLMFFQTFYLLKPHLESLLDCQNARCK